MIVYDKASLYLEKASTLEDRITRIEQIIDALLLLAADNTSNATYSEYQLDDGQTKIKAVYTSPSDIERSINAFEKMKQAYLNRLNGRVVRLRDARNFN